MGDIIITGASRGIGRALALALAHRPLESRRLLLVARDQTRLDQVAQQARAAGAIALVVAGDLSTVTGARALGEKLAAVAQRPTLLVHNAGLWPTRRELTADGFEQAYAVNCVGPLLVQQRLLAAGVVDRVMVVSAGLIALGKFSAQHTPTGADFSLWRTYCSTKLAFALAEIDVAAAATAIDFVALHPGVVATDLGVARGLLGGLLRFAKHVLETPEKCAQRLRVLLDKERWSPAGEVRWYHEDQERPWPTAARDEQARRDVRAALQAHMASLSR